MLGKTFHTIIIAVAFICNSYSQEEEKKASKLYTNFSVGFATVEAQDLFKINTVSKEFFVGIDLFQIKKDMVIYSGLEYTNTSGDFSNSSVNTFISNKYLNIPIILRYKRFGNNNLNLFIDVGLYGSYLFRTEMETLSQTNSESGVGFNLGFQVSIGATYKIDDNWKFSVGLKSKADFVNSSKNDLPEYKIIDLYGLNIGLLYAL